MAMEEELLPVALCDDECVVLDETDSQDRPMVSQIADISINSNNSYHSDNTSLSTHDAASRYDYDLHWDMVGRSVETPFVMTPSATTTPTTAITTTTSPLTTAARTPLWHDPIRSPSTSATTAATTTTTTGRSHRQRPSYHHYRLQQQQQGILSSSSSIVMMEDEGSSADTNSSDSSTTSTPTSIRRRSTAGRRGFSSHASFTRPTSGVPETIEESSGIRASLDAGMVRLRRWIRAHRHSTRTTTTTNHMTAPPRTTSDDLMMMAMTTNTEQPSRQRTLSEPEGIQMRDLLNDPRYREEITVHSSFLHDNDNNFDPNRQARTRWVQINRRFQLTITIVALIFSFLLFAILVCWVAMTSAYVVAIEKKCDVRLKLYFWLATVQLILDVFRADIMRIVFLWEPTNSANERIPIRIIMYNVTYLFYALLVLKMGVDSVFLSHGSTCPQTAPMLFKACTVFISLSVAAWSTIILGYLVPFCFVAALLTWNGYTPASDAHHQEPRTIIGPAAYSREGAPPGTIDLLRRLDTFEGECCICMGEFDEILDTIVVTECDHVFHRQCCQEWLRQARTCPVCRADIPSCYQEMAAASTTAGAITTSTAPSLPTRPFPPGRQEFRQEVVNLLRIWRPEHQATGDSHQMSLPEPTIAQLPDDDLEEGRTSTLSHTSL